MGRKCGTERALLWAVAKTYLGLLGRRVLARAEKAAERVAPVAIQPKYQSFPAS